MPRSTAGCTSLCSPSLAVALKISGSGNATVWATESLEGRLTGSGSASYYGNPTKDDSILAGVDDCPASR